jgi:uncharacterized protein (DUF1778 family)
MQATEEIKLRATPQVKQALRLLAKHEGRSMSNMITTLILRERERAQIEDPTPNQ